MAESNSPAFMPPMNRITDEDPMIVRIDLKKTEIGFRMSQQSELMKNNNMTVRNLKNGM